MVQGPKIKINIINVLTMVLPTIRGYYIIRRKNKIGQTLEYKLLTGNQNYAIFESFLYKNTKYAHIIWVF